MNIHEYQAKELLASYGVKIPRQFVLSGAQEAFRILEEHGISEGVVKIQVHAGGRGKAGGVKVAKSREAILEAVKALVGMKMVNNQTGPQGVIAHKVLLSDLVDIQKENYLALLIDRTSKRLTFIASPEGGMEIEELALLHPEKILHLQVPESGRLRADQALRLAKFMGWHNGVAKQGAALLRSILKLFVEKDASLIEINPLVIDTHHNLIALDAKISVDESALFRHKDLAAMEDLTQISKAEAEASANDLSYVALDGEIGCMVNGAGLAMATMDIVKHYGGEPANFLDVGGGATKERVAEGFRIILSDPKVRALFVNIFGGIVSCRMIAEGIIAAAKEVHLKVPLIVRLEGTHVEEGKKLLAHSGLTMIVADDLADGAQKAVIAARGSK